MHVYIYMYIYIYVYINDICMYVCRYVCMYACMYACMHACTYVWIYIYIYICFHIYIYISVCIIIFIYAYIVIWMCIYICNIIYIYIHIYVCVEILIYYPKKRVYGTYVEANIYTCNTLQPMRTRIAIWTHGKFGPSDALGNIYSLSQWGRYPVYPHVLWKITTFNGKIHWKWPCSMHVCQITPTLGTLRH